jgi:ribonuclease PH
MARIDGRSPTDLRPVTITRSFLKYAEGSCLIEMGNTKVVCAASVEEKVPPFLLDKGSGWVTAEYGMLPRSTNKRTMREAVKGSQGGRTQEIQRLVGRSLRTVTNLEAIGVRTIVMDCDVLQADGGTRTAAITGAYVALVEALDTLRRKGALNAGALPVRDSVAATSVGIVSGLPMLDLNFDEDSRADVDMNVVMTGAGQIVEIQGTGERTTFSEDQMNKLFQMAKSGIQRLAEAQKNALKGIR